MDNKNLVTVIVPQPTLKVVKRQRIINLREATQTKLNWFLISLVTCLLRKFIHMAFTWLSTQNDKTTMFLYISEVFNFI